jgi:low affinity Fe/Cu permease
MKSMERKQSKEPKVKPRKFTLFAKAISHLTGTPAMFAVAVGVVVVWAVTGPVFDYSDTWQLVINTGTTIITFLMVFLIQNTQNRDSEAMQVKLDELIRVLDKADNSLLDVEEKEEEEITVHKKKYEDLAKEVQKGKDGGVETRQKEVTVEKKVIRKKVDDTDTQRA